MFQRQKMPLEGRMSIVGAKDVIRELLARDEFDAEFIPTEEPS